MRELVIHAMGLGLIALAAATSADIAEGRAREAGPGLSAVCDSPAPMPRGARPARAPAP
jgi:hypothetical protein